MSLLQLFKRKKEPTYDVVTHNKVCKALRGVLYDLNFNFLQIEIVDLYVIDEYDRIIIEIFCLKPSLIPHYLSDELSKKLDKYVKLEVYETNIWYKQ